MSALSSCLLCGAAGIRVESRHDRGLLDGETAELRIGLVEWREPVVVDGRPQRWSHLPRCVDRRACRERVETAGEAWPIREAGQAIDQPATQPVSEPMQQVEPAAAHASGAEVFG